MKTWLISDTHGNHWQLTPPDVDLVIFAGDESNYHIPYQNEIECWDFLAWFSKLNITHKIMIAGNHSAAIERRLVTPQEIRGLGIHYLEHEYLEIEGFKFFGSPYTPTFSSWFYMKSRETIGRYWNEVDGPLDVLITHGPPKSILDITTDRYGKTEHVGDSSLYKAVQRIKPKFHVFGHIHSNREGDINSGIFMPTGSPTTYCNAACVRDGEIEMGVINNGIIIDI